MGSSDNGDLHGLEKPEQDFEQNELSVAISKAVTQVLESSDWRSLSFPLDANSVKRSKAKNNVKRPMNAFMLYAQAARKKLSHLYPDLSYAKLSKTLGRIWKSLDDNEKQPFVHEAERLRQKHKIDHPDYKFQPKRKTKQVNKSVFDGAKISTGDVLKALHSPSLHQEASKDPQSVWAHSLAAGQSLITGHVTEGSTVASISSYTKTNTPPHLYPAGEQTKATRNATEHFSTVSIPQAATLTPYQAHFFTPPPLQRSTTAGLFAPSPYRVSKQTTSHNHPYTTSSSEYLNLANNNTLAYDIPFHMQFASPYPKYQSSTNVASQPPPLTPTQSCNTNLDQNGHLLTGVNQILRDMFGNEKSVV